MTNSAIDVQGLLAQLVSIDTTSGQAASQRRVIDICISEARHVCPGILVDGDLHDPHPWALLTNDVDPVADRLLFACHVDAVPTGPASDWAFAPLSGEVEDGHLLGRGAVDMKGGVVAALAALSGAFGSDTPVALLLTSDEEIGALGAARAVPSLSERRIGAVVIPEATANVVHLGHRGALWLEIITRGIAAHGSTPHLGVNAILKMSDVLQRARTRLPTAAHDDLGESTWNLGQLNGGTTPNVVPAEARAVVDHRTVHDQNDLMHWWRSQPESDQVNTLLELPAVWTSAATPWLKTIPVTVSNSPVPYFTDASHIARALPGIPVTIWGPGDASAMHAANERISLHDVKLAIDLYTRVIDSWDGSALR